jgi:hypothetical protein
VTVTFLFGDDLAFVGNMPLTFGDVAPSLFQMLQCHGSVRHGGPTRDKCRRSGANEAGAGAPPD